jgi:hypothetical protein
MIVQNSSPLWRQESSTPLWYLIDPEFPENQAKSPVCGGTEPADANDLSADLGDVGSRDE